MKNARLLQKGLPALVAVAALSLVVVILFVQNGTPQLPATQSLLFNIQ